MQEIILFLMDPFLNNGFTIRKDVTYGEYGNSTEINNPTYVNTTSEDLKMSGTRPVRDMSCINVR